MTSPSGYQQSSKSWGRLAASFHRSQNPQSQSELTKALTVQGSILGFGLGRSYGDSCLNSGGLLVHSRGLDKLIGFDRTRGILTCESGVSLAEILEVIVPAGWFLPVTPGTKFVTVGGAIANDVHGKNHHVRGTFGQHILEFELLRSSGERLTCSPEQNQPLFNATIGGLGLTGLISKATIQLIPIASPLIYQETLRFECLDEFFTISEASDREFEYTVAWVDCMSVNLGRGLYYRARHDEEPKPEALVAAGERRKRVLSIPLEAPSWLMNSILMKAFNELYYRRKQASPRLIDYDSFFYPLDSLLQWNRLYGPKGFFQYQFVLPLEEQEALRSIFTAIRESRLGTSLAVFKRFGELSSPGLLSFPKAGYTLALDFANRGRKTLRLFDELDQIVFSAGGRIYPAKDACMSAAQFQRSYPGFLEFQDYVDPKFSSDFWQRVTS